MKRLARVLAFTPLALLVALAIAFLSVMHARDAGPGPEGLVGKPFPEMALPLLEGEGTLTNADLAGPALVNVWATWCPPCRAEHPVLLALAGDGIAVYGVQWRDAPDKGAAYLAELGDPFTAVAVDRNGRFGKKLGVSGAPETYVIGVDGVVADVIKGPITPETAERRIKPALARLSTPR